MKDELIKKIKIIDFEKKIFKPKLFDFKKNILKEINWIDKHFEEAY